MMIAPLGEVIPMDNDDAKLLSYWHNDYYSFYLVGIFPEKVYLAD